MIDQRQIRAYSRFIFHFIWDCHEQSVARDIALQTARIASACFFEVALGLHLSDPAAEDLHEAAIDEAMGKYYPKE